MENITQQLLAEAQKNEIDAYDTQFASTTYRGKLLCVTIRHYKNGGDGQVRNIKTRTEWHYAGKSIKRDDLDKMICNV